MSTAAHAGGSECVRPLPGVHVSLLAGLPGEATARSLHLQGWWLVCGPPGRSPSRPDRPASSPASPHSISIGQTAWTRHLPPVWREPRCPSHTSQGGWKLRGGNVDWASAHRAALPSPVPSETRAPFEANAPRLLTAAYHQPCHRCPRLAAPGTLRITPWPHTIHVSLEEGVSIGVRGCQSLHPGQHPLEVMPL